MNNYNCLLLEDVKLSFTVDTFNFLVAKAKEVVFNFKSQIDFSNLYTLMNVVKNFLIFISNIILNSIESILNIIFFILLVIFIFSNKTITLSYITGLFLFSMIATILEKIPTLYVSIKSTLRKWKKREQEQQEKAKSFNKIIKAGKNLFLITVCIFTSIFIFFKLKQKIKNKEILSSFTKNPPVLLFFIFVVVMPIANYISYANFMLFSKRKAIPFEKIKSIRLPDHFKQGIYNAYKIVKSKYDAIFNKMKIKFVLLLEEDSFPNMMVTYTSSTVYLYLMDDPKDSFIKHLNSNEIESIYLHEFGHFLEGYFNNRNILVTINKYIFLNIIIPLICLLFNVFYALIYSLLVDIYSSMNSISEEVKVDIFSAMYSSKKGTLRSGLQKLYDFSIQKMKRLTVSQNFYNVRKLFGFASHPDIAARIKYLKKLESTLSRV